MMNFINNFIPEEIISAIGWTIFHSIWQGIIVAVLLGAFLLLADKKSAKLRYNVSVAALLTMLFLSAGTFINYYNKPEPLSTGQTAHASAPVQIITADNSNYLPVFEQPKFDLPDYVRTYFDQHLTLVVSVWLIGFLFFTFRYAGGLLFVHRLRNTGLYEIETDWLSRVKMFENRLRINRAVQIFESARVKVPIAIGHLKPVILLPLGMLSGLPTEQVEAIIIHELVHIKRYDFLVNLIQSLVETLFFYHPVVWWMSSTINYERENCCDDITVHLCGSSLSYSKALYNLQQIKSNESELALAIIGKKNNLYRRIKRMNMQTNKTAYGIRFAAFALLLITMAIVSVYSNSTAKNDTRNLASAGFINPFSTSFEKTSFKAPSGESSIIPDSTSIKKGKRTIKFYDDSEKKYKAKLNNGKLEELYIDGEKVDNKNLPKYEDMVTQKADEYENLMEEYRDSMKDFREKMKAYREKMRSLGFNHGHNFNFNFDLTPFPYEGFSDGTFDSSLHQEVLKNVQKELQENMANLSVDIPPINIPPIHIPKIDMSTLREELKNCLDTAAFRESMKELKENMKNFKFDMKKFNEEMKRNGPAGEAFKNSMKELKKNMGDLKNELKPLKGFWRETRDELVKDNLIQPGDDIDGFKLNKDEMIVNGRKVSKELHKKYMEIYKKNYGKELTGSEKFEFEN